MTQSNKSIQETSPGENPVLVMQQKPEASNHTNNSCMFVSEKNVDKKVYKKGPTKTHFLWTDYKGGGG